MTKRASPRGRACSSRTSTLTPLKTVSNFDHVVTQWMSPVNVDPGSAWISSQVQVVGVSTSPSTVMVQVAVSTRGVASAVSTGQPLPVSYWPGGSRPSGPSGRLRKKPRVTGMQVTLVRDEDRAVPPGPVRADHRRGADHLPVGEGKGPERAVCGGSVEDPPAGEGHAGHRGEAHARGRQLERLGADDLALRREVPVVQ